MEQFSLEKYLANPERKIVTREGKDVRILCIDRKGNGYRNVVALVTNPTDSGVYESINTYWENGKNLKSEYTNNDDLFFVPDKKVGWMNLYRKYFGLVEGGEVYNSEEAAKKIAAGDEDYFTTIKIEWEEEV